MPAQIVLRVSACDYIVTKIIYLIRVTCDFKKNLVIVGTMME